MTDLCVTLSCVPINTIQFFFSFKNKADFPPVYVTTDLVHEYTMTRTGIFLFIILHTMIPDSFGCRTQARFHTYKGRDFQKLDSFRKFENQYKDE